MYIIYINIDGLKEYIEFTEFRNLSIILLRNFVIYRKKEKIIIITIFDYFKKYHLLTIMLYFLVKGYIFTKKEPVADHKRHSHSTTLTRKNYRTLTP